MRPRTRDGTEPADPLLDPAPAASRAEASELPYPVTLVHDDAEWVATIDALPGCAARGATPDEAVERATDAMNAWLATARREGKEIPEPKTSQSHSGRLLLRMPQTLHAELARTAEREHVSLNQFITDVLAGALGWRTTGRKSQVTRTVRTLDGDGHAEPPASGAPAEESRFGNAVLVANGVVVALAAVVAIIVLIVVLTR